MSDLNVVLNFFRESLGEAETATTVNSVNMYRQQGIPDQSRMSSHSSMQHTNSAHSHPGHPGHSVHPSHVQHSSAHLNAMYGANVYGSTALQQQQQQAQVCILK